MSECGGGVGAGENCPQHPPTLGPLALPSPSIRPAGCAQPAASPRPLTSAAPPRASPFRKYRWSVGMARESCVAEAGSAAAALFCWVRDSAPGLGKRLRGAETRERPASAWVKGELRGRGPSQGPGLSTLGCGRKKKGSEGGSPRGA